MTVPRESAKWDDRIAELERWQMVDLENYKQHLAELEEMLTAATDVAVQRGKQLGEVEGLARRALSVGAHPDAPLFSPRVVLAAMGGADGG